jgi:spiro-SPASM protein
LKAIALLDVDLEQTPIGTRSRLADDLCGEVVLHRTVNRLQSVKRFCAIVVACPKEQQATVEALLAGTSSQCFSRDASLPNYRNLIRSARKWSLDAWRGGLGGSSGLDDYLDVRILLGALDRFEADTVAFVPPGSALIDPVFVDAMLDHTEANENTVRLTFAQTPPGLSPVVMQRPLCEQLVQGNAPVGWAIAYKPDDPAIDLAFKPACFIASQALRHASGRLTADTLRSFRDMERIIQSGADSSADAAANWLLNNERQRFDDLPREVEIELTIDSPIQPRLRPGPTHLPKREPIDSELVEKLAREMSAYDDSLITLAGYGDPLLHPRFGSVVAGIKNANVYGLAIRTTGQTLSDDHISTLIENNIDVIEFTLDAWTPEAFGKCNVGGKLQNATDAIERLIQARRDAQQATPIIVPSMIKSRLNIGEMDPFFDGWIRKVGCALIGAYSNFGGQVEDQSVADMSPPRRTPCRRLTNRCFVASDGQVYPCDQDLKGTMPLGHLGNATMNAIWAGKVHSILRTCHATGDLDEYPTCARCAEWHRP